MSIKASDLPYYRRSGFLRGLNEQRQVIYALLLRELLTRFGSSRIGFVTIFTEPAVYLMIMLLIRSAGGMVAPFGVDSMLFVATGIIPFLMFRSTCQKCIACPSANKALLFITEIKLNDAFFARIILEFVIYTAMLWITVTVLFAAGHTTRIESSMGVIYACFALTLFSGGAGLCLAALVGLIPQLQTLVSVFMRIMIMISGAIFSVFVFPPEVREYLTWNPLLHVLEYIRSSFFPVYESDITKGSLSYVWKVTGVLWFFGLILVRRIRSRMLER